MKDTRQYIIGHLDNRKLSWFQYMLHPFLTIVLISTICLPLKILSIPTIYNSLINSIQTLTEINKDILMPKYKQLLMDTYIATAFLIWQISKQHQKSNHA